MSELSIEWLRSERSALSRARGKRKLDLFLESQEPETLIRSLPAQDLYLAFQEIGLSEVASLVQMATPEQFRLFVDFDVWDGYELSAEKVLLWLRLARGEAEDDYQEKLAGLDVEVLELLLRGIVRIFDLEEEGEPGDEVEGTIERTVEGRFVLVYPSEGAEYAAARRLINDLYAQDPFLAGRILYAVRWELESELTETALRWRNARLADLGFPSPEEAASLYAKVDLGAPLPKPAAPPEELPGFFLTSLESGSLLDRALGLLTEDSRDSLELQLVTLLNEAMVADRIPIDDLDQVRDQARAVRATLSLGLEHLCGDDAAEASAQLRRVALKRIFQVGFTRTLELQWRAQRLAGELPLQLVGAELFLPERPDGEALAALLQRRPRYHGGLDGPAAAPGDRAFSSLDELGRATQALDRIEALGRALQAAGLDPQRATARVVEAWGEAGLARVRFAELFSTAAARLAAGLGFSFEALPPDRLETAAFAAFSEDGTLNPSFRLESVAAWQALAGDDPAVLAAAEAALSKLETDLGSQLLAEGASRLDPRFAAPWIVGSSS